MLLWRSWSIHTLKESDPAELWQKLTLCAPQLSSLLLSMYVATQSEKLEATFVHATVEFKE